VAAHGEHMRTGPMNARQSVCFGLLLALIAGSVHAQEPTRPPVADATTPANPMKATTDPDKRPALDSLLTVIRFVLNKQGDPVPVPANLTLEDVIEMLKPPGRTERESVPAASISSLELTGEANDERATLKAKVVVQLRQATEFVKVPLQFNEAILIDARYTGEGEAVYEERKDRDQGIIYWFRGPNPHSMEWTLSVPIRRQLPSPD
jgi:hypothetical protein